MCSAPSSFLVIPFPLSPLAQGFCRIFTFCQLLCTCLYLRNEEKSEAQTAFDNCCFPSVMSCNIHVLLLPLAKTATLTRNRVLMWQPCLPVPGLGNTWSATLWLDRLRHVALSSLDAEIPPQTQKAQKRRHRPANCHQGVGLRGLMEVVKPFGNKTLPADIERILI